MYTERTFGIHGALSAVLAAAIVGVSGLALERGHATSTGAARPATQLAAGDALPHIAMLPEIVVSASRIDAGRGGKEA